MSKKRDRVTLDLHPNIGRMIDELHATGLFGITRHKVVEGLFLAGLREEERKGWCDSTKKVRR